MSLPPSKILRLITKDILNNRDQVLQMMRWRIENQQYYASQPHVTEKSFRNWLNKYVFEKPKLLFLVLDDTANPIGHMGLQFRKKYCEIDNVVRGEQKQKGRIGEALDAFIQWVFKNTPYTELWLRVLSNNDHAIEFYKKHGFVPVRKVIVRRGSPLRFLKMKYEH